MKGRSEGGEGGWYQLSANIFIIVSVILIVFVIVVKADDAYGALLLSLLIPQDENDDISRPILPPHVPNASEKSDRGEK